MGKFPNGCHWLSQRKNARLAHIPMAPPASEIITASVNRARKMRLRLAPSASRIAISFARSAARAANKLPRFAHAASKIKLASSINAAMNACTPGAN
jgi:hypothetical protein